MGYLQINCFNCNGTFELYASGIETGKRCRCPHCQATIPEKPWNKLVDAFFTLEEVNKDLRKARHEYGRPLFQVEYKTHYVKPEKICLDE